MPSGHTALGTAPPGHNPARNRANQKDRKTMNTQPVVIQGQLFTINAPYTAGHVLNENEAAALNQLRAENIRNNFATRMKKAEEDKQPPLGQDKLNEYDATYQFGIRAAGKLPQDPVEKEAYKLAEVAVIAALKARGTKLKELPEGKLDELVTQTLEKRPHFREQAKKVVEARKEAVGAAAVDLGEVQPQQAAAQ